MRSATTNAAADTESPSQVGLSVDLRLRRVLSLAPCLIGLVAESPLHRLEPAQRSKLLGSLILLTLGGVALVILAWLALRIGRRSSKREDLAMELFRKRPHTDDWASKPLIKPDDGAHHDPPL